MKKIHGKKTYLLGILMLGYLAWQFITKTPVDQNIVYAMLTGMGLAIRHGIKKANGTGA